MDKPRVLFVDDEQNILKALRRVFYDEDYEILTAGDARQGLQMIKDREVALVLSDYRMPEVNGVEFLKQVREIAPFTTRMILTGFADMEVVLSAINEGHAFKFIMKPWQTENLKQEIQQGLERHEILKEKVELLKKVEEQNHQLKDWNESLESKIDAKTREIRSMNQVLQQKILELQGRDKVLEFLLDIHTLEASLELILNQVMRLIPVHRLVAYVLTPGRKSFQPRCAVERREKGPELMSAEELISCSSLHPTVLERADDEYYTGLLEANRLGDYSVFIPFEKQRRSLGLLLLDNTAVKQPIQDSDLKLAAGFASLAAIAVNEYLVTTSSSDVEKTIQEILE